MESEKFHKYNEILEKLEPIKLISPSDYFAIYNKIIDLFLFSQFELLEFKNSSESNNNNTLKCKCHYYDKKYSCVKLFDLPKCKHIESIKDNFPMIKILLDKGYGKMRLPINLQVLSHNMEITECIEFITEFSINHNNITKIEIIALLSCMIFIVSNFSKMIRNRSDVLNSMLDMIDHFFDVYKSIPDTINEIFQEFFSNSKDECLEIIKSWKMTIYKWYKHS
jgi:hypothetical protein